MKGKRSARSTGGKIALIILILAAVAAGGIAWWLLGSGGPKSEPSGLRKTMS